MRSTLGNACFFFTALESLDAVRGGITLDAFHGFSGFLAAWICVLS